MSLKVLEAWSTATESPPFIVIGPVVDALVSDPEKREAAAWFLVGRDPPKPPHRSEA